MGVLKHFVKYEMLLLFSVTTATWLLGDSSCAYNLLTVFKNKLMACVGCMETNEMFRANQNLTLLRSSMLIIIFYMQKTAKGSSKNLTMNYHTQKFLSLVYPLKNKTQVLKKILTHKCPEQHYAQWPKGAYNPNVYQ